MSIFEILNLRTEFEEIINNGFLLPNYNSDINNLEWFIENGRRKNGLREGFNDAIAIAESIVEAYYEKSQI